MIVLGFKQLENHSYVLLMPMLYQKWNSKFLTVVYLRMSHLSRQLRVEMAVKDTQQ